MKKILLYIWELPQNIIGLILTIIYKTDSTIEIGDRVIRISKRFPGGISLGSYIFSRTDYSKTVFHEYGHSIDSKRFGPLYLLIIGLPSILWAWWWNPNKGSYYRFYTERRADKNGNVKRQ